MALTTIHCGNESYSDWPCGDQQVRQPNIDSHRIAPNVSKDIKSMTRDNVFCIHEIFRDRLDE